ncbi:MAG: CoA transferase subunit A, partial [Deltaproteobacteria bacterium]|nr:CoA transferase subunit A [Deltaproteobacteria bacterium]
MQELKSGTRELMQFYDCDEMREYFRNKDKSLKSKLTTAAEAVRNLISDGEYVAVGGFGGVRIPTVVLHEIVRQRKKNLGLSGHTATHDFQILVAGECINRCDIAYIIGLEARGLSSNARKAVENGKVKVVEWTNAALAWRYKAAAMGVPFLPARNMMGTDVFKYSAAKEIECPFTGKKLVAYPALHPDVGIIHVHRADIYGNCQIDGIQIADYEMARAAKKLIITTEQIVSTEFIRNDPTRTIIPYYLVDAVIEAPFGSYPGNMPYMY